MTKPRHWKIASRITDLKNICLRTSLLLILVLCHIFTSSYTVTAINNAGQNTGDSKADYSVIALEDKQGTPPLNVSSLSVPLFNQRNYSQRLGMCYGLTIASDGCLVTSLAMVYKYFNISVTVPAPNSSTGLQRVGMDPPILDDWIYWQNGYFSCSSGAGTCCFGWTVFPSGISASARQYNTSTTGITEATYAFIDNALNNNQPVIAGVHWSGHGEDSHFVVITGRNGNTYNINDPYNGVSTTLNNGALV